MRERFRKWLVNRGNEGASKSYPGAVNRVSKHYSDKTGVPTDIYQLNDIDLVREIADKYKQSGVYSSFGYEGNALFRNAIGRYADFLSSYLSGNDSPTPDESIMNAVEEDIVSNNFTYERDLQYSLCNQTAELFPQYQILGNNNEGVEYSIGGKRIDVLLEHKDNQSLLAIELKSGAADFRVLGQMLMYIGLVNQRFPDKEAKGLIISGSIDESLKIACSTTNLVSLKTYKMSLELEEA